MKQLIITTGILLSFVVITSYKEGGKTELAPVKRLPAESRSVALTAKTELVPVKYAANKSSCNPFVSLPFLHVYGNKYECQANKPKQISEYVRRIFEDSRGNLWFGTGSDGVCRYDGDTLVYFSTDEGLSGHQVTGIVEDQQGNIWFSTLGGISRYDGKQFTNFTEKDGLSSNTVWSLYEDSKGTIWAGTVMGLYRYKPEEGTKFGPFTLPQADVPNPKPRFSTTLVSAIMEDKGGNLWFGTDGAGVFKYNPSAQKNGTKPFTHITMKEGLCDNSIVCIIEDREGNLWFSSRFGGLSRYNPSATKAAGKSFTNFTVANGDIGNNEVWTMYEDRAGSIWFSSEGYGMYRFKDNQLSHFGIGEGLPIRAVQSIFEDKSGRLWVGGGNDGLHFFDGNRFIQVNRDGPWRPGC